MRDLGYMGKYLARYENALRPFHFLQRAVSPSASVVMQKRFPDCSFYQGLINWDTMRTKTDAVIIRAGQNEWTDARFSKNWPEAKRVGMKRGVYFFYDDRVTPDKQANLLISLIRSDLPEMEVVADWENTYGGPYGKLSHVVDFMRRIETTLPTVRVAMYTGYYWFKDHSSAALFPAEYEYLKNKPLWLAWYTSNPANVLIPAPWSKLTHWQFGTPAEGHAYGTQTNEIDMNWFNGTNAEFDTRYSNSTPPPPPPNEEHNEPYPGVKYHRVFRFGSWCSIVQIKPGGKRFSVTKAKLKTVSQTQADTGAQVVINGGDFNQATGRAVGLHASEGIVYSLQTEYEPWVNFTRMNTGEVNAYDSRNEKWNSLAGKRFIVQYAAIATRTSAAWYEVHPRTLVGVGADGTVIQCVVDGRQPGVSAGVDLFDAARIMLEFGAVTAIDLDGGGSSAMNIGGQVKNVPIDDNVPGRERPVGTHILTFVDGVTPPPPPTGEPMEYKVVSTVGQRETPTMFAVNKGSLAPGTVFTSTVTQIVDELGQTITFIQTPAGWWVPKIYSGMVYVEEITVIPPPTTTTSHNFVIDFDANTNPISVFVDGTKFIKA